MLTSRIEKIATSNTAVGRGTAFAVVGVVLLLIGRVLAQTVWPAKDRPPMPSSAKLGHAFLTDYLLPFEVGSIVLLGAMIGAVVLARRAVRDRKGEEP